MPYDVAFSLHPAERFAYVVIFGQFEGNQFSWERMAWMERRQ